MFRADLAGARTNWIAQATAPDQKRDRAESPFLNYRDDAGRVIDFHALRHTFISNLAAGGVHPKTAQTLARHSTITLTMDRYSHVYRGDLASALKTLPDLSQKVVQRLSATGTDAIRLSPDLSPGGKVCKSLVESGGLNNPEVARPQKEEKPPKIEGFS